jgi:hypothetical protein
MPKQRKLKRPIMIPVLRDMTPTVCRTGLSYNPADGGKTFLLNRNTCNNPHCLILQETAISINSVVRTANVAAKDLCNVSRKGTRRQIPAFKYSVPSATSSQRELRPNAGLRSVAKRQYDIASHEDTTHQTADQATTETNTFIYI